MSRVPKREQLLRSFMAHLEEEESFHYTTSMRYRQHVRNWLAYLGSKRKSPAEATREDAAEWFGEMRRRYSSSTLSQIISSMKKLYGWLVDYLDAPVEYPFRKIKRPRVVHTITNALEADEVDRIVAYAPQTYKEARDKAIALLLYDSALRVGAVRGLNLSDIDWNQRTVTIRRDKGGKAHIKPFHQATEEALRAYLTVIHTEFPSGPSSPVFYGERGGRISYDAIRRGVKAVYRNIEVGRHCTPHSLRKTQLSELYEASGDVHLAQQMGEHAKVQTTLDHYIRDNPRHLRRQIDQYHRLAQREPIAAK